MANSANYSNSGWDVISAESQRRGVEFFFFFFRPRVNTHCSARSLVSKPPCFSSIGHECFSSAQNEKKKKKKTSECVYAIVIADATNRIAKDRYYVYIYIETGAFAKVYDVYVGTSRKLEGGNL